MNRCAQCGLRLAREHTRCPRDGAIVETPSAGEVAPRASCVGVPGYSFVQSLGVGGFGEVFRATRSSDGLAAAVKVAHRETRDASVRLEQEIAVLQAVGPPAVPEVYDHGVVDGASYVAMECLEGSTLADLLEQRAGALDEREIAHLAPTLLDAVEAVHRQGYVHADLKPENIFIERGGRVRVLDFGTAQRIASGGSAGGATSAPGGENALGPGTAEYMSPEQCSGTHALDGRSDVYALGAILCEMLTGAPPFWGPAGDVREAHKSRRPAQLAKVATELSQVVLRCLAKEPDQRFGDIGALRAALGCALARKERGALEPALPVERASTGAPAAEGKARQKRLLAVVHFTSSAADLTAVLARVGGKLAYKSGSQCAAVFGHDVADNPARSAMAAAGMLVSRGLCKAAVVDVSLVHVQAARDGSSRYFSPSFGKKDRYPTEEDQPGTLLTLAAAQVLADVETEPARSGFVRVVTVDRRDETMVTRPNLLFGRDDIVTTLLDAAAQARASGAPAVNLVVAPAGYGKSHLASELSYRLERESFAVLWLRPAQDALLGSRATTQQLLRACVTLPTHKPSDGGRELWQGVLGASFAEQTWAAASLTLEWIGDDHPEVRKLLAAPGALRSALAHIAGELLRHKAADHPTAVVLDGAHLADDASLDALDFATLARSGCPLAVVALARPLFQKDRPGWCRGAPHFQSVELQPLGGSEAGQLARRLLDPAETVPNWAVEQLVERTQGVPGLLVELVRGLKREGLVRKHERGTAYYLAGEVLARLPDMPILSWSTSREVESLPAELTAHARLASVWGRAFRTEDIDRLITVMEREGPLEEVVLDAGVGIARLLQAGLLVTRRNATFDFRTVLLREAVYDSTPTSLRTRAHRAAYTLHAELPPPHAPETMANLARHASESGLSEEAMRWYLALGERALERQVYQEAASMLDAALANANGSAAALEVILDKRGHARFRLGRFEDAASDFARAAELAAAHDPAVQAACLLAEAMVVDWMHQLERSNALVEEARKACPPDPPPRLRVEMLMALGRARYRANDHEAAAALLSTAAAAAEHLGDQGYEVFVISLLLCGYSYAVLGKLDEGEATFARAVAAAEARHDQAHLAAAINNRIGLWFGRAATDRLRADLQRVLDIARENGFAHMLGHVEGNFAETLYCLGELDSAVDHARRALEAHRRVGASVRTVNTAEILRARIMLYQGDMDAVEAIVAGIDERAQLARARGDSDVELLETDQVVLSGVRLALGRGSARDWDELVSGERMELLAPHERADLLEIRAMSEWRAGRRAASLASLRAADDVAKRSALILAARIGARLSGVIDRTSAAPQA